MHIMINLMKREKILEDVYRNVFTKWIHGLLYLHGLTLRILKKNIVGQIFKRSFASK